MAEHKSNATEAQVNQARREYQGKRKCFWCRRPFKSINKDCKCWCHKEAEEEAEANRGK